MIISRLWTSFLLAIACASTVAWLVALMHERGIRPLRRFWAFINRQPKVGQVLLVTFFIVMWVMAGTKPGGGAGRPALPEGNSAGRDILSEGNSAGRPALPEANSTGRDVLSEGNSVGRDVLVAPDAEQWADFTPIASTNTARTLTAEDFAHGFVMHRVGTDEAFDFAAPSNATVCADWEAFGAAEDWIYLAFTNWAFHVGTNEISRFRVLSFGRVDLHANHPHASSHDLSRCGGAGRPALPADSSAGRNVLPAASSAGHPALSEGNSVGRDVPVAPRLWPLCATFGVVPRANWPRIAGSACPTPDGDATTEAELAPSRFWHFVTPSNTLQMTWRNVLLGRCADAPLSFQAELWPSGRFVYRYDLSRCGGAGRPALPADSSAGRDVLPEGNSAERPALSVASSAEHPVLPEGSSAGRDVPVAPDGALTDILVGASLGGPAWTTNSLPTNVTSLAFHPLSAEDALDPDCDGDGLSLLDELFVHHTDPDMRDTDLDGVPDGDEVVAGTDPLVRDTDGDGLVDGSDPDPCTATPIADLDGDGIPDACEDRWFGGTNAFNMATNRDGTGFTLAAKILGGMNPANAAAEPVVASDGSLVSWKLFGGFAADWPADATDIVWERTFAVNRTSAWQQLFVSASPADAAAWFLHGMALEWETDTGASGSAASSPAGDSLRIPLGADDFPSALTLRLRAAGAHPVRSPAPLHLIAYAPALRIEGGSGITGESGATFRVFTDGSRSRIGLAVDRSLRPHRAPPGADESDMAELEGLEEATGGEVTFAGGPSGGTVCVRRPGAYTLPVCPPGVSAPAPAARAARSGGGGHTVVVLDPSASWSCAGHGCAWDGLLYSWQEDAYRVEDGYPLDSKCLRRMWFRSWDGGWRRGGCGLLVSAGCGDGCGWVTTSADGGVGKVYVDGVEVWSGAAEHTYSGAGCGWYGWDALGDGCDGCESGCADGSCDSLEGTTLGSLRFRIPLGAPVKGQVAGFAWFSTDGPVTMSRSTFRLLAHPDAHVSDVTSSGVRRITCRDPRGRDLRIENIANGVRMTICETDAQTLEHTWEIVNVGGSASQIRLRKISRLGNVMSDETCTYAGGDWTRFDNVAGVGTRLTAWNGFADCGDGVKRETRTVTDANGAVLSSVTVERSRIGEFDRAVLRETHREESTGHGVRRSWADWWDDPAHSGRHGQPRLVRGDARAWVYTDFDANGHETLRVEQRGDAPVPSVFPSVVSNGLHGASALADAFVTVRDFEPPEGDSCHPDDAAKARCETRYVVTDGVAAVVGRTWTRYVRIVRDGYDAIKKETWRAAAQDAARDDAGNAFSCEIAYADTGEGTPLLMRDAVAESLDENGVLTVNAHSLSGGVLSRTTRRYGPDAGGCPSPAAAFPTYETVEMDAAYGTVLRRTTRLTDGDTVIADERSVYDEKNRLRSTTYLDGTSLTNAWSCCRLLWRRDREGRKVLRSAQTGTDHLYNATEDVWLADVSTNGRHRVTQRFFDALGRETNTVVYAGTAPGEATEAAASEGKACTTSTTAYPHGGSDHSVRTDERGRVTVTETVPFGGGTETSETVLTNGVEVMRTVRRSRYGGGSSVRREWPCVGAGRPALPDVNLAGRDVLPEGNSVGRDVPVAPQTAAWTEERRFDCYLADGGRVEYVVTKSSDCGTVTNSVSTYDLLGRLVSSAVPGANGATLVTSNAYDGATTRILSAATTGSPAVTYGYNPRGERISTSQDGKTILDETSYETVGQQIHRVTTTARVTGSVTNSVQIRKVQLTGLSDALRSRTVSVAASGRETVTETSFDADTGVLTSVSQTGESSPVTERSLHCIALGQTSIDGTREMAYDAFGRNVAVAASDASGVTNRMEFLEYDPSGNVVRRIVDFMDGRVAEATAEYDLLGREVRRTDALGNETVTGYDALGRTVSTGGDAYPIMSGYDTAGRRTHGSTTRDGGTTWDATQWEFDPASGVNTAKRYADGSRIAYGHTDDGRNTRTTWARGAWRENAYNARNLVGGTAYSGTATPSVAYTYAASGKTATATLSDGTSHACAYDDRLLNTNESVTVGDETFAVGRTYDQFRRAVETAVVATDVRHAAKTRLYDSEDRVCGCALTNAAGRGVAVSLAYDGSYVTNATYVLPDGGVFSVKLTREAGRRNLVTRRDCFFGGQSIHWHSTEYDLLNRPTNATGSVSPVREWLYNRRSELAAATVGADRYGYAYDSIGNRLWSAANAVTNSYTANSLNQYVSAGRDVPVAPQTSIHYDADGNMTGDGRFSYAYDAENRLVSATSAMETNGAIRVLNAYDHRNRRIRKTVQRLHSALAPSSAPEGVHEWETQETRTFVWDGSTIVMEKVETVDGTTRTFEYFWGADKSGSEQGAGGVGGLLAVSVDGVFYIPCYDHNGNIVLYVSETGSVAAQYVYDPYGNVIDSCGDLADVFPFGFSTQYHDRETGLVAYKRRFYSPVLGRWLNRDPIEEQGGENLYCFCENNPGSNYDINGLKCTIGTFNILSMSINSTPQWIKADLASLESHAKELLDVLNDMGYASAATSLATVSGLSALLLTIGDIAAASSMSPDVSTISAAMLDLLRKLQSGPMRLDGTLKWERCECVNGDARWVRQSDIHDSEELDFTDLEATEDYSEKIKAESRKMERTLIRTMYETLGK